MLNATSTFFREVNNASSTMMLLMADPIWLPITIILLTLWVLPWKGYALWRAVKNDQKGWFIAMFLLNTLAILEIFYIFFIDRKKRK